MFDSALSIETADQSWDELELMPMDPEAIEQPAEKEDNIIAFPQPEPTQSAIRLSTAGQIEFKIMIGELEKALRERNPGIEVHVDIPAVSPACGSPALEKVLNHFLRIVTRFEPATIILNGQKTNGKLDFSINAFSPSTISRQKALPVSAKSKAQAGAKGLILRDGEANDRQATYRFTADIEI